MTTVESVRSISLSSKRARLRIIWLKVHRWIGLGLLLVFALLGVTGSLLVWPDHFDRLVNGERYPVNASVAPAVPSVFLHSAQKALLNGDYASAIRYPDGIVGVVVAGQVNGPAPLRLGPPSRAMVWLDPADGAVLARAERGGGFQWSLRAFHGHLLLASAGHESLTVAGLLLLISAGVGLWLWWPGARNIGRALQWRSHLSINMNLHRQGGALVAVILIIETCTGTYISASVALSQFIERSIPAAGHEEGPPVARTIVAPRQNIDDVLKSAQSLAPSARIVSIFLPTENNKHWMVNFKTPEGAATVRIADESGAAAVEAQHKLGQAERIESVMAAIHFGNFGPIWKFVVFSSGIALVLLSVTGLLLWLQGRAKRMKPAA